jgi:hypothetical protein
MEFYPLADFHSQHFKTHDVYAIKSDEFRPPKKGEWYLSGALIDAYQAKNDLTSSYRIAKLVRIEKITTYKILEYL